MAELKMRGHVRMALAGDEEAVEAFMSPLRETVAMFEYVRDDIVATRTDAIATGVYQDLQLIEQNTQGGQGLAAHWNEMYPYYFQQLSEFARTYVVGQIWYIRRQFSASTSTYRESVLMELLEIKNQIPKMKYPSEY